MLSEGTWFTKANGIKKSWMPYIDNANKQTQSKRERHKYRMTERNKEVQMKKDKEKKNLGRQRETKSRTGKRTEIIVVTLQMGKTKINKDGQMHKA